MNAEMAEDVREVFRSDGQRFESVKMRDDQSECIVEITGIRGLAKLRLQREKFGAQDIGASLVDVFEVQAGPQRRTGDERFPPAPTYVGQRYQILILVFVFEVVRDE